MKIKIADNYYMRSNEMNVILSKFEGMVENKKTNEDEELWSDISFHATPTQCLKSFADRKIRKSKVTTFEGLQKEYAKMNKLLEEISAKLGE